MCNNVIKRHTVALFTEYDVARGILKFQCKTWEFRSTSYYVNSQANFFYIYVLRKVRIGTIPELSCEKWDSHFVGRSRNSYFSQCNSGIARAQSGNREKVRICVIALVNSLLIFYIVVK